MFKISQKARNCLENFIRWGGLAYLVYYIVNREIVKAMIFAAIFGTAVVCYEYYFKDKFRD